MAPFFIIAWISSVISLDSWILNLGGIGIFDCIGIEINEFDRLLLFEEQPDRL